uniref:hypothetical protein n=2 Tax=Pseudomonadota TaxID=1224 RepID=UPI001952B94E
EIGQAELYEALMTLAGFGENPFLRMQASQLCLVDNMLNHIEQEILEHQLDDEPPRGRMAQLSALTPMW